jgi:hypothetical protein
MTSAAISTAITAAMQPRHFCVADGHTVRCDHDVPERCRWELFRGHLLDPSQTRDVRDFTSWHVYFDQADEPLVSVKSDGHTIFVVRALRVLGHEAYEDTGVIHTRLAEKWQRELVGSVALNLIPDATGLRKLVRRLVLQALVGTSRLPITSLESPLPQFALGQIGFVVDELSDVASRDAGGYRARELETLLRRLPAAELANQLPRRFQEQRPDHVLRLCERLFQQLSLSPCTPLIANFLHVLRQLMLDERCERSAVVNVIGRMLRLLMRHLTAFDLRTFHNRGANYPDAPLLDGLLKLFLEGLERLRSGDRHSMLLRALRMAWLVRHELEGLLVPDQPTSPGDYFRVLAAAHAPMPEGQLLDAGQRSKRLFAAEPTASLLTEAARNWLAESLEKLDDPRELRELGVGLFLDRPLGVFKQPGEVDRTPLVSYEAFSRRIAQRRLDELLHRGLLTARRHDELTGRLRELVVPGVAVADVAGRERPGVVSLADARRASSDFIFTRTTKSSLRELLDMYQPLPCSEPWLLIRSPMDRLDEMPRPFLTGYDDQFRPRIELGLVAEAVPEYLEFCGAEFLRDGLRVLRLLDEKGTGIPVADVTLRPVLASVLNMC